MAWPWHSPLPSCHGPARATGPHCPRLSPQRVVKSSHLHRPPPQPSRRWRVGCTACGARTHRATCTHVQGGLTWAAHTGRQRSAQAALAVGSTHHGPCTLMGSAQCGQYTHTHGWCSPQAVHAHGQRTARVTCSCGHCSFGQRVFSLFTLVCVSLVHVKPRSAWQGRADVSGLCHISLRAVVAGAR